MTEMSKREPDDAEDAGSPLFSIPPWAKAILGYGAFAYAIGYVVIFLNASELGYLPPDLPQARVIWAGIFPIVIMICGVVLSRKLAREYPPSEPLSSIQIAKDILFASCVALICTGFPYVLFWIVLLTLHQGGDDLIAARVKDHAVAFRVLVGLGYAVYMYVGLRKLRKKSENTAGKDRSAYLRQYAITLCVTALLLLFIGFGYLRLPMRLGFGAPSRVRLLIPAEYAALLFTESVRVGEEKMRLTSPLDLLTKTDKEYVVRMPADSTVLTISADGVKAVVWLP